MRIKISALTLGFKLFRLAVCAARCLLGFSVLDGAAAPIHYSETTGGDLPGIGVGQIILPNSPKPFELGYGLNSFSGSFHWYQQGSLFTDILPTSIDSDSIAFTLPESSVLRAVVFAHASEASFNVVDGDRQYSLIDLTPGFPCCAGEDVNGPLTEHLQLVSPIVGVVSLFDAQLPLMSGSFLSGSEGASGSYLIHNATAGARVNDSSLGFYINTDYVFGLLVTPIPEPETYALMLAGLGLLGWIGRREKLTERDAA